MQMTMRELLTIDNIKFTEYKVDVPDVSESDLGQSHDMVDCAAQIISKTPKLVETLKIRDMSETGYYDDLVPCAVVVPEWRRYIVLFADKNTRRLAYISAIIDNTAIHLRDRNDHPAAMHRVVSPVYTSYKYDFDDTAGVVNMIEYHNAHCIKSSRIHGIIILHDALRLLA
ncbi:MAG: hypothetical protein NC311_06785 [Muribaculaceae bacterium]|nr:hypothetical protein [Muribaculaceae bacterium]